MNITSNMKPSASEREVAKELLNIGLANSADSFSGTIQEKVLMEKLTFNYRTNPRDFRYPNLRGEEGLVFKSEIKGDIPGVSFLIFDKMAIENIGSHILPPSMKSLPEEELPEMREALLSELDNIVTASMVSQLANYFNSFMYGAVPQMEKLAGRQFQTLLKREGANFRPNVMVSTHFYSVSNPVGPRFVWFFNDDFIRSVKKLTSTKGVYALESVPA